MYVLHREAIDCFHPANARLQRRSYADNDTVVSDRTAKGWGRKTTVALTAEVVPLTGIVPGFSRTVAGLSGTYVPLAAEVVPLAGTVPGFRGTYV
jgi:hypothetical protein